MDKEGKEYAVRQVNKKEEAACASSLFSFFCGPLTIDLFTAHHTHLHQDAWLH